LIVPLFTTGALTTVPNRQGVLHANTTTAIPRSFISAPSAAFTAACLVRVSFGLAEAMKI